MLGCETWLLKGVKMFTRNLTVGLIACGLVLTATSAMAAAIGNATKINPSVTGDGSVMSVGDDVEQNETVQTGAAGEARLRFIDSTDLSVGPGSKVKLDKFVFSGGGTASSVVMSATRGAFRFATGNSPHEAYRINTPAAAIGVRGTQFSFDVRGGRLKLTVTQGVVIVCPNGKSKAFCTEVRPGQTVQARAGAPAQILGAGSPPRDDPPPPRRRARRGPVQYDDPGPPQDDPPPPRRRRAHRPPPVEYDDPGYPQDGLPPALGLGLELGIPLILGDGPRGGRGRPYGDGPSGGRRADPCLYRRCQ